LLISKDEEDRCWHTEIVRSRGGERLFRVTSFEFISRHLKNYKDLQIYKAAHRLAAVVHGASMKLPQYEMYEEGSQVRRSSKSIAACVGERRA
jgi:hypothetical protein